MFLKTKPITIPVKNNGASFPVGSIYCVGRNYIAHAVEMGEDKRVPPFFFSKATWTIANEIIQYPKGTSSLQHEVEFVIAVGEESSIYGFSIGVDLTRRDIQKEAKMNGRPWFSGKNFQGSSVVSEIVLFNSKIDLNTLELELYVNGDIKQKGNCSDMIWNPGEIMCELTKEIELKAGDLIFTGTPDGIGDLEKGDRVLISIPEHINHTFSIK